MDLWSRTRDTFVSRLEEQAKNLGLVTEQRGLGHVHGDWMVVRCPLCTDKGGSASLSVQSAQLVCHQCGAKDALFDWLQKVYGVPDAWTACKNLAQVLGISMPKRGKGKQIAISPGTVDLLVSDLWDSEEAKNLRDALLARGFSQSELAKYHIGFDGGGVVFPRVEPNGDVHGRAHRWHGPHGRPKWTWNRTSTGSDSPNYYWPAHFQAVGKLWICEGEWDCLVLREKLGVDAVTWTGGVTSSPTTAQIPEWFRGLLVFMVCDNDSWQGLGVEWAPDEKGLRELRARRLRFLEHARVVSRFAADVRIVTVPIPPSELWGGDIRDWYDKGGRVLSDLDSCSFEDAVRRVENYQRCSVKEASSRPEQFVEFAAQVASVDSRHDLFRPDATICECSLGAMKVCQGCKLPSLSPEGVIHWDEDPQIANLLACSMVAKDSIKFIERHVIGRPRACPSLTMRHSKEGRPITVWLAQEQDTAFGSELPVISDLLPSVNDEIHVRGQVLANVESFDTFVVAKDIRVAKSRADLTPHHLQLVYLCQSKVDDIELIRTALTERWMDLASNVTRINNLPMIRLFDLTAHSARRFMHNGDAMRGWLDTSLIGVTRCGKTETASKLFEHFGRAGYRASTQGNFTLAGLVAGNAKGRDGNYRVVPGVFPRHHRQMVILDEAHLMADAHKYGNVVSNLQEIRDHGIAESIKVAGQHKLPAEVRLLLIGNPPRGLFETYKFKCEAFLELYGDNPEFTSRMDMGWIVTQEDSAAAAQTKPTPAEHKWTKQLCSLLRQRAWDLDPGDVEFDEKVWPVVEKSMQLWTGSLDQELPMFNGPDKANSLLRIAIAIANLCYSHESDPTKCYVRAAHVALAAEILEDSWEHSDYFAFSSRKTVTIGEMVWVAEYGLTRGVQIPQEAATLLSALLGTNSKGDMQTIMGLNYQEVDRWLQRMIGARLLLIRKNKTGFSGYSPTKEGAKLIHRLIGLANDSPEELLDRRRALETYFNMDMFKHPIGPPHKLVSLLEEHEPPF